MSKVVDARGRSCPEPVIMARQGLSQAGTKQLTVLVDTAVAKENVTRFLLTVTKKQPTVEQQADGSWAVSVRP